MVSFCRHLRKLLELPAETILKMFFFSSLKLQYCRTIVFLNKLKLFKETSFSKATMVDGHAISRQEKRGRTKAQRDFPPRKDGILRPRLGCLGTSLPLPQSLYGRTLTSQPKCFGSIDYQICSAMALRYKLILPYRALFLVVYLGKKFYFGKERQHSVQN